MLASTWEHLGIVVLQKSTKTKDWLETCTCAYHTRDTRQPDANSNLQEHAAQRGKVDQRRDWGWENKDSEQSRYHVIAFTVYLRLTESRKKKKSQCLRTKSELRDLCRWMRLIESDTRGREIGERERETEQQKEKLKCKQTEAKWYYCIVERAWSVTYLGFEGIMTNCIKRKSRCFGTL